MTCIVLKLSKLFFVRECVEYLLEAARGDKRSEEEWTRLLNYGYVPDGEKHLTTPFCELIKYMPGKF